MIVYFLYILSVCVAGYFVFPSKWWLIGIFSSSAFAFWKCLDLEDDVKRLKEKVERIEEEGEQK